MRILIHGSENICNSKMIEETMDYFKKRMPIHSLILYSYKGVNKNVVNWAKKEKINYEIVFPDIYDIENNLIETYMDEFIDSIFCALDNNDISIIIWKREDNAMNKILNKCNKFKIKSYLIDMSKVEVKK